MCGKKRKAWRRGGSRWRGFQGVEEEASVPLLGINTPQAAFCTRVLDVIFSLLCLTHAAMSRVELYSEACLLKIQTVENEGPLLELDVSKF